MPDRVPLAIVVVLHHRLDLLEHQLAAFAGDPHAREARVVCVVDGPGLAAPAAEAVPLLADLYGIDLRLVALPEPGGRAAGLNAGADAADADALVLLHGGAIATEPGWLGALLAAGAPAAPVLLDEHGAPHPREPEDEPCLLVAGDTRLEPRRRLDGVRRVPEAQVHWLARADEPTVLEEAPWQTA